MEHGRERDGSRGSLCPQGRRRQAPWVCGLKGGAWAGGETGVEAKACAGSQRGLGFGTFRQSQALHGLVSLLYVMPGLDKTAHASPLSTQGTPGSSWRRV